MGEEGCVAKGVCGLSMGGVHAAMAAGLYPLGDLSVVPMLAPRSAAVAYCDGAMRVRLLVVCTAALVLRGRKGHALPPPLHCELSSFLYPPLLLINPHAPLPHTQPLMAWDALEAGADAVPDVVARAAQAVSHLREASHALAALDDVRAAQRASLAAAAAAAAEATAEGRSASDSGSGGGAGDKQAAAAAAAAAAAKAAASAARDASERVEAALRRVLAALRQGGAADRSRAFTHLRAVLEAYTDVARYPRCARPRPYLSPASHDIGCQQWVGGWGG